MVFHKGTSIPECINNLNQELTEANDGISVTYIITNVSEDLDGSPVIHFIQRTMSDEWITE